MQEWRNGYGQPCISSVCPWQPWFFGRTQPLGFIHALFEVGLDSLERARGVDDKGAIVARLTRQPGMAILGAPGQVGFGDAVNLQA